MPSNSVRPALIRFLTTREGGRLASPAPGLRSQIELGSFQTSCVVDDDSGRAEFPLGEVLEVRIRVLFEDRAGDAFASATAIELFEGNKLVATGELLDTP